jgi:hypothetical protein
MLYHLCIKYRKHTECWITVWTVWFLHIRFCFLSTNNIWNMIIGWPFHERTIIKLHVAYGCETWPSRLTDEQRLMVFENGVMSKIFWSYTEEVTGGRKICLIMIFLNKYCLCLLNENDKRDKRVARMRKRVIHKAFLLENLKEEDNF